MTKPQSRRKADVTSKLDYADHQRNQLMDELFASKSQRRDPAFLVHAAADIIAAARECFDYLGQDIVELYVIPFTKNAKLRERHASGKIKMYFPFYEQQVTKPGSVFQQIKNTSPALYKSLTDFTTSIENKEIIQNTLFNFHWFIEMKDMVNEKKHDKLIAVVSEADQEYIIENELFRAILPIKAQAGWQRFSVSPGSTVSKVAEYRFAFNDREVADFCLFSVKATQLVLTKFYTDHFA